MVSAAVLVKLKPEVALNTPFVSFVDTLIRDTANPSVQERYFSGNLWPFLIFLWGIGPKRIQHTSGFSIGVMFWNTLVVWTVVTLLWMLFKGIEIAPYHERWP